VGDPGDEVVADLHRAGVSRGDLVSLVVAPAIGFAVCVVRDGQPFSCATNDPAGAVASIEAALRPRWVMWSNTTAQLLVQAGARLATSWDIASVHRLLDGGWRADPPRVWARLRDLDLETIPQDGPPDLFSHASHDDGDPEEPIRPDGHIRPTWATGGWDQSIERVARWAQLAATVAVLQQQALAALPGRPRALATARSESAAELLCAELSVDGLPMDRAVAEGIIAGFVGPRPRNDAEAAEQREQRDAAVLCHAAPGTRLDLRSPADVKALLRRIGVEVPDTRAWRLEAMRDTHPLVAALLTWRKAERVATTYGYAWLDRHLGDDGRLRGEWSGSDGAAGRMTASAGLHNMPADMRPAVLAGAGHVFVRADLGQIEPRVLAAVSHDQRLAAATRAADMYAPVAERLGVERSVAKVAVLGAMYGQTTGHGAEALRGLEAAYPVAMDYLRAASVAGQERRDLRTYGGRLVRLGGGDDRDIDEREARGRAAARGRYGRNAMVQGAAAELFKVWAALVRARAATYESHIVLCLHDELLVHVPAHHAEAVVQLVDHSLQEAAHRWADGDDVLFVADISVVERWSDA
jgi:DNA polymerase I